ncbi:MAG: hypothetical protein U0572_12440 [Phycisphaerales bacterium]
MTFVTHRMCATAFVAAATLVALPAGCSSDSSSNTGSSKKAPEMTLDQKADDAVARIKRTDPGMSKFFDSAIAYAVFPQITSGAFIIGGAHGDGVLYEGGKITGEVDISAGTIGAQIGGQGYSEIIFFKQPEQLKRFKAGTYEVDARATAVAVRAGASTTVNYDNGVAVFSFDETGLMAQAAVGGQKFKFTPR